MNVPGGASTISSPRLLRVDVDELRHLLRTAGSDPTGAAIMARKADTLVIRVDGLKAPAANILKQEMLSVGGDCATHRDVILGGPDRSSVHLIGNERRLTALLRKLPVQPFGLRGLGEALAALLGRLGGLPKGLTHARGRLEFGNTPRLMGILNVTPDSFSDGGRWDDPALAVERGLQMLAEGADIIDVGGESTRPGSAAVSAAEESSRVLPVIRELARQCDAPISVDTSKAAVAAEALAAGAAIVNDVSALADPEMAPLVAESGAAAVLMHMRGEPSTMQEEPAYDDVVDEIYRWLETRVATAEAAGIERERLMLDPGIGFGKRLADNTTLIRRLGEFQALGLPLLLGASRKSFLGELMDEPDPDRRLEGSLAAAARATEAGARILRVHDLAATRRFLAAWLPLTRVENETEATKEAVKP
jgi:dihydropteroate synthase